MNIEDEKKALETALASIYTEGKEESHPVFCEFIKRRFENGEADIDPTIFKVWLAAKEHAKEMAKPTVKILIKSKITDTSYPFVLSLFEGETFNGVLEDFRTEDDAKEWAKVNGYRVIK